LERISPKVADHNYEGVGPRFCARPSRSVQRSCAGGNRRDLWRSRDDCRI